MTVIKLQVGDLLNGRHHVAVLLGDDTHELVILGYLRMTPDELVHLTDQLSPMPSAPRRIMVERVAG